MLKISTITLKNGSTITWKDIKDTREPMRGQDYSFLEYYNDAGSTDSSYSTCCPNCGLPYWDMYPYSTGGTCKCKFPPDITPKNRGWLCPACGCGNAPWASKCGHCKKKEVKIW